MSVDFILNGRGSGNMAQLLLNSGFDANALRPYIGNDGKHYTTVVQNGVAIPVPLVGNATATLRKDEWRLLDEAVIRAAKPRLKVVSALRGAGLQYTIPNGMGKTIFEYETQSDITPAVASMDGLAGGGHEDAPVYELAGLPLPIFSKKFSISARQLAASRNGGSPLDTSNAELASRRVAELAESFTLGKADVYSFGGYSVYGLTNHPNRNTKTLTAPTAGGWAPSTLVSEVLNMKKKSQADGYYGPWMLYNSPDWDEYLDNDYTLQGGNTTSKTLRNRLKEIDGITDCQTLDYLEDYDLVLVQMSSDVVRMVVGMEMQTIQWETHGGMMMHYMVMCIIVPQLRNDQDGNMGLVHGST